MTTVDSSLAVSTENLTKVYSQFLGRRSVLALDNLSLEVNRGEIFGLLGPNGAGKTTLLKILLAVVKPTSGSASLLGRPVQDWNSRRNIGFLPENHRFPPFLTAMGALQTYGQLSRLQSDYVQNRANLLLERVGLAHWKNDRIKEFSKGMMQRLGIAQALINDPEILFLDEPTDGVDPIGRREIRDLLAELRNEGKTIFLNSHLLSEVEMICDRVAILHQGKIVQIGNVKELTREGTGFIIELETAQRPAREDQSDDDASLAASLKKQLVPDEESALLLSITVDISTPGFPAIELATNSVSELNDVLDRVRSAGLLIRSVQPRYTSLEARFIQTITDQGEDAGKTVGRADAGVRSSGNEEARETK